MSVPLLVGLAATRSAFTLGPSIEALPDGRLVADCNDLVVRQDEGIDISLQSISKSVVGLGSNITAVKEMLDAVDATEDIKSLRSELAQLRNEFSDYKKEVAAELATLSANLTAHGTSVKPICRPFGGVDHGSFLGATGPAPAGALVSISCETGYALDPKDSSGIATCHGDGNWTNVPTCRAACISQVKGSLPSPHGIGDVGTCVFPFVYRGTEYSSCAEKESYGGVGWCAFDADYSSGRWGYCTPGPGCPDGTATTTTLAPP